MSEIFAQLYDGNPISISDAELEALMARVPSGEVAQMRLTQKAVMRKLRGTEALFTVFVPAGRSGAETILAVNVTGRIAQLIIDSLRHLYLLPWAIRELRSQAPEDAKAKWRA